MREFLQNCKRLIQVARKPGSEEFNRVTKITTLGFIFIGALGFLIMYVASIITGV